MNMFTNNKKTKKFILVLVLLILFGFCCPNKVHAVIELEDITAAPAKVLWWIEKGVLKSLNNIFANSDNQAEISQTNDNGYEITELSISLTPDNIIKGKFLIFDANIFKPITDNAKYLDYEAGGYVSEGKIALRNTVAGWYYALRNLAIVTLLSVLVYVGIRMIMSTLAQDRAKYKTMFKDWLVALCLVVVMHYMMIGILNITSMITDALGGGKNVNMIGDLSSDITGILSKEGDSTHYTYNNMDIGDAYAKVLVLGGIILYTILFAVKYLKREFTIIFLILLGPVSCITYPIDKISDGKAQAFNRWFSEFLYQIIIQPFHLLLYIVLIGSAVDLANSNILYALVCFAVMIPAEKFIKEMFGFKDKLGSPLGAAMAGAMGAKALNAIMSKGKGASGGSEDSKDNTNTENQLPPKTVDDKNLTEAQTEDSRVHSTNSRTDRLEQDSNNDDDSTMLLDDSNNNEAENDDLDLEEDGKPIDTKDDLELGEDGNTPINTKDDLELGEDGNTPINTKDNLELEEDGNTSINTKDDLELEEDSNTPIDTKDDLELEEDGNTPINTKENIRKEAKEGNASERAVIKDTFNKRAEAKYGTSRKKARWKKRAGKSVKALLGLAKGAAIVGAGTMVATGAIMTGNGKEALGVISGVGGYVATKVSKTGKKVIKRAWGAAKDYGNASRDNIQKIPILNKLVDSKEEKALNNYKDDIKNVNNTRAEYRKSHDGVEPNYEQLQNALEDRYELARRGLSEDQINDVMPFYRSKMQELVGSEERRNEVEPKTLQNARDIAADQAKYTAGIAKAYSRKDFETPKTMQNAFNAIYEGLGGKSSNPDTRERADKYARMYLTHAAKMNSVGEKEIALPPQKQTVDIDIPSVEIMTKALGVGRSEEINKVQMKRINELTVRLHKAGMNNKEIETLAKGTANSRIQSTKVIDNFETQVKFLTDDKARSHAKQYVANSNKVETDKITKRQVNAEMKRRLEYYNAGVKEDKQLDSARAIEDTVYKYKPKSEKDKALDIVKKHSAKEMSNSKDMDSIIKRLAKSLEKEGKVAPGTGINKAIEIAERAADIKGVEMVTTFKTNKFKN